VNRGDDEAVLVTVSGLRFEQLSQNAPNGAATTGLMPVAVAALGGPFSLSAMSRHSRRARQPKPTMSQDTQTLAEVSNLIGNPATMSYEAIAAHPADEIVSYIAVLARQGRVTFINIAKGIIALETKIGEAAAKAKYIAAGISTHTVKNASQATKVWGDVVARGHADEAWFDTLAYQDFVLINKAIRKLDGDVKALVELSMVGTPIAAAYGKLERLVEVGLTAYKTPPVATTAPAVATTAATTKTTTTPATQAATSTTTTTPTATPSAETAALAALEKATAYAVEFIKLAVDEVAVGRFMEALAAASITIAAARDAKYPKATVADLADLKATVEQHAAA